MHKLMKLDWKRWGSKNQEFGGAPMHPIPWEHWSTRNLSLRLQILHTTQECLHRQNDKNYKPFDQHLHCFPSPVSDQAFAQPVIVSLQSGPDSLHPTSASEHKQHQNLVWPPSYMKKRFPKEALSSEESENSQSTYISTILRKREINFDSDRKMEPKNAISSRYRT